MELIKSTFGSRPLGDPAWAPFFIRISVGLYFVALGTWGAEDFQVASTALEEYVHLPPTILDIAASLLPYLLITCGSLLLVGFKTIATSLVAIAALLPLFLSAASSRGLFHSPIDLAAHRHLAHDAAILGACISLIFTGAGLISIDHFLKNDR